MNTGAIGKLAKLGSMPPREIAGRAGERLRAELDRARRRVRPAEISDRQFLNSLNPAIGGFKDYLRAAPAQRFYFDASGPRRAQMNDFVAARFPEWIEASVAEAERLCRRRVPLLGYGELDLGLRINWHRDPVTGREWPRRFWTGYDLVSKNEGGDPKCIHELNRHQHLPRLAKAWFYTGDERYAREAVAQMESWVEQNPESLGINWQSSLEIALRSISWLWTIFLLLPSSALDERAARRIGKSLFAQLDHVCRFPSTYTSPNTHLIGEATALFLAGSLFPELKRAGGWRQMGAEILTREIERQVGEEGVYGELSTHYHCYALDFYLQALLLAQRTGPAFPNRTWHILCRMMEFLADITRPDGTIPPAGDEDGGRALALSNPSYRSFPDALCCGAVLFLKKEFKFQAGPFREETFWLMGAEAFPAYATLAAVPGGLSVSRPAAGYFVQRSGWGADDSHLLFDGGGLGMFNGGHGHADALAFTLFAGGEDLLIDPGTYIYNTAPEWRNHFRSTRAHNTVTVDGADQSEPGGTFQWKRRAAARVIRHFRLEGLECIEGEHDGYRPAGIMHRRRLLHLEPDCWVVLDDLRGSGEHTYDFYYHFAPGVALSPGGNGAAEGEIAMVARGRQAALRLFACGTGALVSEVICGREFPAGEIQGWASGRYGEKRPAPVLRASARSAAPFAAITVLALDAGFEMRAVKVAGGCATACSLERGARRELLVAAADDLPVRLGPFIMRGDFFRLRFENDVLKQLLAIDAWSFCSGAGAVLDGPERLPYFSAHFWKDGVTVERGDAKDKVYVRNLRDCEFQCK